jgi:hypothetical protein
VLQYLAGLTDMVGATWAAAAQWTSRNKLLSFSIITGTLYLLTRQFGTPSVPTAKERASKRQQSS